MGEDAMSDSTLSKNSGENLIAKSPAKKPSKFFKRDDQMDSFKWIPNPSESILSGTKVSTLESVSSTTTTTSDFSSNYAGKTGYIRGNPQPLLKYNEFNSLFGRLACPVEVKPAEGQKSCREDELSVLLITGGIQMMLGILMAVFGVLIIVHNASLAGAGSGLWGGAVAMLSGLLGVLAGMKGCFPSKRSPKVSPALLTAFLAMCLISFALSNLVLVLTCTGLIRDMNLHRFSEQEGEPTTDWPPILSNSGLIIASVLQCIMAMISGYKCYRKVCPCTSGHSRLEDSDSHMGTVKPEKKVSNWLGNQFTLPKRKSKDKTSWAAPNIVLLPPPPREVPSVGLGPREKWACSESKHDLCGQVQVLRCRWNSLSTFQSRDAGQIPAGPVPLWTFLQPPPASIAPSSQIFYCPSVQQTPCCCYREPPQQLPTIHTHRPAACLEDHPCRRLNFIQPDPKVPRTKRVSRRERRISAPTAEDVAKTYTGRDREIAEEFIAIAMDKRRRSRSNSVGAYVY